MTATNELVQAERFLRNPLWRINNLYWVVNKEGQKQLFKLNWAQEQLYRDMWYCNIILKARQLGISTLIGLLFLDRCLFNSNCSAGIICHTREDSEAFFKRVKFAYDQLPDDIKKIIPANSDTKNELSFANGSSIRVGMMMRGSTLQYLHVSEYGKICAKYPEKAREILTGSLNTIAPGQYIFIESTAEGRYGTFFDLCKQAQDLKDKGKPLTKLDYRFHFFPWHKHSEYCLNPQNVTIPSEIETYFGRLEAKLKIRLEPEQRAWYAKKLESQKEDMKREFPSLPEESFESSSDGNYYSNYVTKARQGNRITKLFHEPKQPVHTAWDLGYSDSTSIWLFQLDGQRINVLEYYENSSEPLTHYIQWLKAKGYTYGKHLTPHDISHHEFSSGLTRIEVARGLGVDLTQVQSLQVVEGIDAVRNILDRCYFDEEKCALGIKMLDSYRKEWNEKHACWSTKPLHNFASHGADAFRTLAVGLDLVKDKNRSVKSDYEAVRKYWGT